MSSAVITFITYPATGVGSRYFIPNSDSNGIISHFRNL